MDGGQNSVQVVKVSCYTVVALARIPYHKSKRLRRETFMHGLKVEKGGASGASGVYFPRLSRTSEFFRGPRLREERPEVVGISFCFILLGLRYETRLVKKMGCAVTRLPSAWGRCQWTWRGGWMRRGRRSRISSTGGGKPPRNVRTGGTAVHRSRGEALHQLNTILALARSIVQISAASWAGPLAATTHQLSLS